PRVASAGAAASAATLPAGARPREVAGQQVRGGAGVVRFGQVLRRSLATRAKEAVPAQPVRPSSMTVPRTGPGEPGREALVEALDRNLDRLPQVRDERFGLLRLRAAL